MPTRERVQASIDLVGRGRHVEALDLFIRPTRPQLARWLTFWLRCGGSCLKGGGFASTNMAARSPLIRTYLSAMFLWRYGFRRSQ